MADFFFVEIEGYPCNTPNPVDKSDNADEEFLAQNNILFEFIERERAEKIKRLRFVRDKVLRLYASVFVKLHISSEIGISAEKLIFSYGKNGKPYFDNSFLKFNYSHTENAIAVAFSLSEIGVDIEKVSKIDLQIAKRYFTDTENRYVFDNLLSPEINRELFPAFEVNDMEIYKRFFSVWTRKEAILKSNGKGIGTGLKSVDTISSEIAKGVRTFVMGQYIVSIATNDRDIHFHSIKKETILSMAEDYINTRQKPISHIDTK